MIFFKYLSPLFLAFLLIFLNATRVSAQQVLGVHILRVEELTDAEKLLEINDDSDAWKYVTIPFTLDDVKKLDQWQNFFNSCQSAKIKPILRLATSQTENGWKKPSYSDVIEFAAALRKLDWPSDERIIIIFNEPNHKGEWDGDISPDEYADILEFSSRWFHTEQEPYIVLPAALDLAAPNSSATMEAFNFWRQALVVNPDLFTYIDAWNSHSYPNPAFSSSPTLWTQNSIRGYRHELDFVKKNSQRELKVYITETGWAQNWLTSWRLTDYYRYAAKYVWSDPRVVAVTPFLLKGSPGPFTSFSFIDENGNKTKNYEAYRQVIESMKL